MPERVHENLIFILYVLAAVSGGLGGCSIAAHHMISGKKAMRFAFFFAYAVIGVAFGLLTAAYGAFLVEDHPADIIGPSIVAGAVGALALSSMNLTARFILKQLGIEVVVTMRRGAEDRRE